MGWPLSKVEAAQLDLEVRHLARAWALRMLHLPADADIHQVPRDARKLVALAELAAYERIREHVIARSADAAGVAADVGADYTDIGDAVDLSRQGARRRWPDLAGRTKAARAAATGQPLLSDPAADQAGPPGGAATLDSDDATGEADLGANDN